MMNRHRPSFWVLLGLLLASAIQPAFAQARPALSWSFAMHRDRYDNPHGNVYLLVSGRRVLVLRNADVYFHVLPRDEYASHDVPRIALTACAGWWAGGGEELYVVRRHGRLEVYNRGLDEDNSAHVLVPMYRRILSIALWKQEKS